MDSDLHVLRSTFCVLRSTFCVLRSTFHVLRSAFCVLRSTFLRSMFLRSTFTRWHAARRTENGLAQLARDPDDDFAHGTLFQSRERRLHLLEGEHTVHHRALADRREPADDLFPCRLSVFGRVVRDSDPANPAPPEQQRRGVEVR